ncbi:hypothetical protein CAPTEDRAFT_142589, partial [Capitella teleta]
VQLHDHQVEGVRWLAERQLRCHGCILGDEMGLGKTCQTISLLLYLKGSGQSNGPHLILSPLSVLQNWADEFERFAPDLTIVKYIGAKDDRPALQEKIRNSLYLNAVITTYEMALKDESFLRSFPWFCLVIDEGHRLKNSESLLYKILVDFEAEFRLLLTGTPVQNNLSELYSLLSFVAHKIFRPNLMEVFIQKYRNLSEGSEEASKLHDILRPFLLRRLKTDVLHNLPVKSEVVLYHGLSALQKKQYKAILTRDASAFESNTPVSLMNIVVQLRKSVSHPYLFDAGVEPEPFELGEHLVTSSGKLMLLDKLLSFLKVNGHKVLVFSQMTRSLDVIQDYLALRGYTYERLDGSVRGEERHLAVRSFNQDKGTFIFLLSTKAGGVGLNLVGADTVIFFDSDFNPQNDLQAAARAHRIGQKRNVKVIRLVGKNTLEEIIIERARKKLQLSHSVIEAGKFTTDQNKNNTESLSAILKFGVDTLFKNDDATTEDVDFEKILGQSKNGNWMKQEVKQTSDEDAPSTSDTQNLYVFEGKDYKQEPSAEDIKKFADLMSEKAVAVDTEGAESRSLRKHRADVNWLQKLPDERSKRKPLSAQELAERQKKRQETMARKAKEMAEKEEKKLEMKRKKREALWEKHHYESLNIQINEEEQEEEEEEEAGEDLRYVLGDVTHPQEEKRDAIVIHCADDSGAWGSGGLFSALDARSTKPEESYTLAGEMQDLALGDVHLIPIDDVKPRVGGHDYLALVIAQHWDKRSGLTGIKLSALEEALRKIYQIAKERKASIHLPRIGHNTPDFNWYGTERLLRKILASRGIPTYMFVISMHIDIVLMYLYTFVDITSLAQLLLRREFVE